MLNRPNVSSDEQSGYLTVFRSPRPDQRTPHINSFVKPPVVASRIRPPMGALKRSISLDLTDSRASHNSSDSGYTSDYYVNSPETFTSDVGVSNRSLSFSLSNSSNKSDSVFYRSTLEQCSEKSKDSDTSPTDSDNINTTNPDEAVAKSFPNDPLQAYTGVPCKPIGRNIIRNTASSFSTLSEETSPSSPGDPPKPHRSSEKPRSLRVSAQHSKDISKIAKKFESCSSQDKLEFVSYYVATNEQRILKRFITETYSPDKDKDLVFPVSSLEKISVTFAGEVQVFSLPVPRKVTTPKMLVRSFSVDCLECRIYPKLRNFSAVISHAYFSSPTYVTSDSKQILRPIEIPSYDLGLKPYKRKIFAEPKPRVLEKVHENHEIGPVLPNLEYETDPPHSSNSVLPNLEYKTDPPHSTNSELERPCSLFLDTASSLDSVSIENFLIQSSVTSSDRVERTLQLSEWGRWRRESIDLPAVFNQRRSNFVSSKYMGRVISSSHGKQPCKLFLSKPDLPDENENPLSENVAHSQPAAGPTLGSYVVRPSVKQNSLKRNEKSRRQAVDLTFVGFNAFSHFKHLVNLTFLSSGLYCCEPFNSKYVTA